jgi:hypothetical protein
MLGRLTLNPIRHIDPVGTVLVPLALTLMGGFIFGWAKPVPVTWENLRNPKRDMVLVAAAGPLANLAMALLWALAMKIGVLLADTVHWVALPLLALRAPGAVRADDPARTAHHGLARTPDLAAGQRAAGAAVQFVRLVTPAHHAAARDPGGMA